MITLKRALKSLIRQPLKSILLLIILLVLLNAMAASIAIGEESHQAIRRIDEGLGRIVTFDYDLNARNKFYDELYQHLDNPKSPYADDYLVYTSPKGYIILLSKRDPQEEIDRIHTMGASPLVESFTYRLQLRGLFDIPDVQPTGSELYDSRAIKFENAKLTPFLIGVHRTPLIETEHSDAFIMEGRQLTEEEMRTGAPSCIISKELAELNNLKPGDTLSAVLTPSNIYELVDYFESNISIELEVVGIIDYQKPAKLFEEDPAMLFMEPEFDVNLHLYNEVIVPNALVRELQKSYISCNCKKNTSKSSPHHLYL